MKIIKPFNSYIAENFETPGEAPVNISSAQSRMGDTRFIDPKEELKSQLDTINSKIEELKKKNKIVITCCRSGNRSGMAKSILQQHGIECYNGGAWNILDNKL
jgi:rhodanese-related sulfurtransferase